MSTRPLPSLHRPIVAALVLLSIGSLAAQDPFWLEPRLNTDPAFQYTPSPGDWRDVNIYQIFTDRFADGDASNNNVRTMRSGTGWYGEQTNGNSWYNTGNSANANERHLAQGGDWEGLRQKIPYLVSMGVKSVWISSVQKTEQGVDKRYTPYHAYHPTDYYRCEPLFGDFAKLKQTIDELHANGIYVILDVVPNHLADLAGLGNGNDDFYHPTCGAGPVSWWDGTTHAWPFDRLDWIHCNGKILNYDGYPETQLGAFVGTDDLATERQDVQDALDAAFKNLIDATDCDGFRVDAIKHVDHTWIKNWATSMRQHATSRGKGNFIVFGELFSFDDGFHSFFTQDQGSGFNSVMWFSMMNTMKDVFAGSGPTSSLTSRLQSVHNTNVFGEGSSRAITFIDNHDVDRVSLDYGSSWEGMLRPAMGLLYCGAPVPTILYGTEHGFNQGGNPNNGIQDGDYQRECMMDFGYQWGNAQGDKFSAPSSIKDLIGTLNAARDQHVCLRRGGFTQRWESGGRGIYAFTRDSAGEEALVVLNTDWDNPQNCTPAVGMPDGTVFTNVLDTNETATVSGGTLNVTVPTRGLKVFVAGGATGGGLAIANTRNWPLNGSINAADNVYLDTDTSPKGEAVSGEAIVSTDGGATWTNHSLARNPSFDGPTTDAWNANLGPFPAGTALLYAVSFEDSEGNTIWDNNGGANYGITVNAAGGDFTMDGALDSSAYLVVDNGMRIWAAVRGTKLYFATWSSEGGGNDHFLLCSDDFGNPEVHPWTKPGTVNFWFGGWPWLAAEGDNDYAALNNGGAMGDHAEGPGGQVLEGVIDLVEVFGEVPEVVYLTALSYGTGTTDGIAGQAPVAWDPNDNIEIMEMAPVAVASMRDEDGDGYHDGGQPVMESEVAGEIADANYGLRRFFIDELASETANLTIRFTPNLNPAETISSVELITNLNRREHAAIQENRDGVTTSSNTYYRAYPMTENGGTWEATVAAQKCGAYRATVRYFVDGEGPFYYTDNGLRRDLAIVVSPKKALDVTMYEVNPLSVEATGDDFASRSTFRDLWMANTDRPDAVSVQKFDDLGVNMLWLQPIHPIGLEARGIDPSTGSPYEPGSPYAVKDYWQVNSALGASNTEANALAEFQAMVGQMDGAGIGVMMDGTFNHSAPDAILGQGAVDLFGRTAGDEIRNVVPEWYSMDGDYGTSATGPGDVALAPDRRDFGKWPDVREFYFGDYDALVKYDSDSHTQAHLLERDDLEPLDATTRDLWEDFAYYPLYWLDRSGHPAGTPAHESSKGIDGLRCDFAQGLPSEFWEYCINKTRSRKWDFLFMAESLDGSWVVDGSGRHGVGYRSARHFDILNENIVFYWRDTWFDYPANGPGTGGAGTKSTSNTEAAYEARHEAFEGVVLLNNLTSHDEVFPSDDPYELLTAYAQVAALKGIPMIMYGQEAGAQNDFASYGFTGNIADGDHNWSNYESNFGKNIPHFKRWNDMSSVWFNRDLLLEDYYGRINSARAASPALRNGEGIFLDTTGGGIDEDLLALAKFESSGVSAASQDVVFVIVNNDPLASSNRVATYDLAPHAGTLGIEPAATYNLVNLLADDPSASLWGIARSGQDLIDNGITVILSDPIDQLGQAQYLRLVDTSVVVDGDGDGLPDAWETTYGLDPNSAVGIDGASGDFDGDGTSNWTELLAGTDPSDPTSVFQLTSVERTATEAILRWTSVPDRNYRIWTSTNLEDWDLLTSGGSPVIVPASASATTDQGVAHGTPDPTELFFQIEVLAN